MDKLLKDLMFLYDNLTAIIDMQNKSIESLYFGKKKIAENLDYTEFANEVISYKDITTKQLGKLTNFMNSIKPSDEPFSIHATYTKTNDEVLQLEFKGFMCDETHLLLIISDIEQKNYDTHDPLTKVLTRDLTINKIDWAIKTKKQFIMLVFDIDNFKMFNDTYGHIFGDIVLVEVASTIKKVIGKNGFVGRFGGDEFIAVIFLDSSNYELVHTECSKIKRAIAELQNHNVKKAPITATIGCVSFPNDGDDYDTLFRKADKALIRGKNKGRNCFIIYTKERCGDITDAGFAETTTFDHLYQNSLKANIVVGVMEILNRNANIHQNIEDALSLIGNYFVLDRVLLIAFDIEKFLPDSVAEWINPKIPELQGLVKPVKEHFPAWHEVFDSTGMFKLVNVVDDNTIVSKDLLSQKVVSVLAFELKYLDKILGTIRFDTSANTKFWQQTDVSALMLISKVFGVFIYRQYENELHRKELFFDKLTNVYNFSKWRDEVMNYMENADDYVPYSLVSISVNEFPKINEIYGTYKADSILKHLANSFRYVFDREAIYCRTTDERFVIFIPNQDLTYINSKLAQCKAYTIEKLSSDIQLSLIIGVYHHEGSDTLSEAIDKLNLTRKKAATTSGKYYLFNKELYEETKRLSDLEFHQNKALENEEFKLYLQPKINTDTGEIVGAEALTRWLYQNEKLISPEVFIPLFEKNGFITKLDFEVFENVCKFQRSIIDEGKKPVCISVNVSRYQQNFDYYINKINYIRNKYDIPSSLIEIEITESLYISNEKIIKSFIENLHKNGYKVSMDDFGSGYSNLSSLSNFDFDLIKLDKGFCANQQNEKEKIILSFVMNLAKELNIDVLCEGVETQEYADYLKSLGCNIVQGFLYDRPLPYEKFKNKYLK